MQPPVDTAQALSKWLSLAVWKPTAFCLLFGCGYLSRRPTHAKADCILNRSVTPSEFTRTPQHSTAITFQLKTSYRADSKHSRNILQCACFPRLVLLLLVKY